MHDTRKVMLGKIAQSDGERLRSQLGEHGIEIALIHNSSTCTSGCAIQLELWAHPEDVPAIQQVTSANWLQNITEMGYDPNLANAVFNPEAADATCPACGTVFATTAAECSDCGLQFSVPQDDGGSCH